MSAKIIQFVPASKLSEPDEVKKPETEPDTAHVQPPIDGDEDCARE